MAVTPIEDLEIGMARTRVSAVTQELIDAFGEVSGDKNPVHFDADYAASTPFGGVVAHGILSAGFISAVIGEDLPGHGTIYLKQSLAFKGPVRPGDDVATTVTVTAIDAVKRRVTLECVCRVGERVVLEGEALVLAPSRS
ncbi:MAG: MaoC family dehydratase [Pseudomonadota bacterium]